MADYYDLLGAQLAEITERGVKTRRPGLQHLVPRVRAEIVAISVAVFLVVAVGAVFLTLRSSHGAPHLSQPVSAVAAGPPVMHNYSPHTPQPPAGGIVCETALAPPGGGTSPSGVALVYATSSGRNEIWITAKGLKPTAGRFVYAVWIATWGSQAKGARLVGVIEPSVGRRGKLIVQGPLPRGASGAYQVLITLQPSASARTPGRTVLEASVDF